MISEPIIERQFRLLEHHGHEADWQELAEIDLARWTSVTDDNALLTHLLRLFWTWDYTASVLIHRFMFLEDLRFADLADPTALPPGASQLFCSSFLVNSLLAVACLYTTHPDVYSIPGDNNSRGESFVEEAIRLLPNEPPSLTKLQGVALLHLRESLAGDTRRTDTYLKEYFNDYMRLRFGALEIPSDFNDWESRQGRELRAVSHILWAMYFINARMVVTFQLPFPESRPRIQKLFADPDVPQLSNAHTAYWWPYPVRDTKHLQPSHYHQLLVVRCSFLEIIEEFSTLLSNGRFMGDPTSLEIARTKSEVYYTRLIQWKLDLPEYLQADHSTLPAVIVLHILYDKAIIELLNPLMEHYYDDSTFAGSTPRQLRLAANFSLINKVWVFRTLYTVKFEHGIVQACFRAAMTAMYDLHNGAVDIFVRACQGLYEAGEYLKLANTYLAVTKGLLMSNRLVLPPSAAIVEELYYPALMDRHFAPFKEDSHLLMYWPKKVIDYEFASLIELTQLLSIQRSPSE